MSNPEEFQEDAHTYMVQDRSNQDEIARVEVQGKMVTRGLGGVLPELDDPTSLQSILDVGCGTGSWLIETARTYPTIERLVGADISSYMLAYARDQATAQHVGRRVEFHIMDALRRLEFSPASFDLVNLRLAAGWIGVSTFKELACKKVFAGFTKFCCNVVPHMLRAMHYHYEWNDSLFPLSSDHLVAC